MVLANAFFKIHQKKDSNGKVIGCYITYGDGIVLETNPATFNDFIEASNYLEAYLANEMLNNKKTRLVFKLNNKNETTENPTKTATRKPK